MSKKTTDKLLSNSSSASSWPWTACVTNPKTLSFRAAAEEEDIFKTMNSAYRDSPDFSSSSDSEDDGGGGDSIETVIKGLRSERLFFEPDETSSILQEPDTNNKAAAVESPLLRDSVAMEMDSTDPFLDFRRSMEEMLEAHEGVMNSWDCLEELLTCYLRVNGQSNHGYIVGAFVDLLITLSVESDAAAAQEAEEAEDEEEEEDDCVEYKSPSAEDRCCCASTTNSQYSFTSPLSFYSSTTSFTSPCLSSLEAEEDVEKPVHNSASSSSLSNVSTF